VVISTQTTLLLLIETIGDEDQALLLTDNGMGRILCTLL